MSYTVTVSCLAVSLLSESAAFLARVDNAAATKMRLEVVAAISSLKDIPERFPFLDDEYIPKNKYRNMVVSSYLLLIYQIKGDTVLVDYVVDCRKDYSWLIR